MHTKKRQLALRENVKTQALEYSKTKRYQLGKKCHIVTVFLMWFVVFGYIVASGTTLLYIFS